MMPRLLTAAAHTPAMTHFAISLGYICTANPDGSIPLHARVAATIGIKDDRDAAGVLVSQANAAPDLLAACNGLLGLLQLICARDDMPPSLAAEFNANHRAIDARAAIAKAEGRT